MNCNDVREHLASYLYDELPHETRVRVDRHLESCAACAHEVKALRGTVRALDAWNVTGLGPAEEDASWRVTADSPVRHGRWFHLFRASAVGAAAAIVMFAALVYTQARIERRDGSLRIAFHAEDGMAEVGPSHEGTREFLLLLRQGTEPDAPATPAAMTQRIKEYAQWSADARDQGRDISGQKLTPPRYLLGSDHGAPVLRETSTKPGPDVLGGYFLVGADSFDDAMAIARTCPHLKHGGRIEVREIDPRTRD